jgi:hypothetical protein
LNAKATRTIILATGVAGVAGALCPAALTGGKETAMSDAEAVTELQDAIERVRVECREEILRTGMFDKLAWVYSEPPTVYRGPKWFVAMLACRVREQCHDSDTGSPFFVESEARAFALRSPGPQGAWQGISYVLTGVADADIDKVVSRIAGDSVPVNASGWVCRIPDDAEIEDPRDTVHKLESNRSPQDLSVDELARLAKAYNQAGNDHKALEVTDLALQHEPANRTLLDAKACYLWNVHVGDLEKALPFFDDCLRREVGDPVQWHVMKAEIHHSLGARWVKGADGNPTIEVENAARLDQAIEQLRCAFALDPRAKEMAEKEGWVVTEWNEAFAGLLGDPRYKALLAGRGQ